MMKKTREEYIDGMAKQLKEWSARIDELEARASAAGADVKQGLEQRIRELREKRDAAAVRLQELRNSTGEAWETMKTGADRVWKELKDTLAAARDKFRKAA